MIEIKFEGSCSAAYDGDKKIGECVFLEKENTWNIIHTEVDSLYQGQGIARKLVESVLAMAKNQDKKLIADCSYAKKIIEK